MSENKDIVRDHAYDGIQEYDNPMPSWWSNIFIATAVWAVIYVAAAATDKVPEYTDELDDDLRQAAMREQARMAALPPIDEAMIAGAIADADAVQRGSAVYAFNCASCHNQQGQGLIGPNLTDNAFLYGHEPLAVYDVIQNGAKNGMPAWGPILPRQEMLDVIAFTFSVRGTTPPNPKKPEGDIVTQ